MKSVYSYHVVVFILLSLTSCAHTVEGRHVEMTEFLGDYSQLRQAGENDALLSYWKKGVNWSGYKKIILVPVIVNKPKDSELSKMTHVDGYRLKELLDLRMQEALKKDFMLVNKPANDTLLMQFAITDAKASFLLFETFSSFYPSERVLSAFKNWVSESDRFIDKVSIEGKVFDSTTGELLMVSADNPIDGNILDDPSNNLDEIGQSYTAWAVQLSRQLCLQQRRIGCQ
jgi:hypothetical protein